MYDVFERVQEQTAPAASQQAKCNKTAYQGISFWA